MHVTSPVLLKHYKEKVKKIGKIDIYTEEDTSITTKGIKNNTRSFPVKSDSNLLEKTYLQLLILNKGEAENIYIPSRYFSSDVLKEIYLAIKSTKEPDLPSIIKLFEKDEEKKVLLEDIIFRATEVEENTTKQLEKIALRLRREYLIRRQKALSVKIAIAEESNDTAQIEMLLKKMLEITKLLKEISHD
jgi:hypothetical protein